MNHRIRGIAVLTAAVLALSTFAACGDNPEAKPAVTSSEVQAATTAEEIAVDPYDDELGQFDFDGYRFRVLSVTYDPSGTFTLFDSELNGEVLNDSLCIRNREIEERFNIVFEASEDGYDNCNKTLRSFVSAGEDAYDLVMLINRHAFADALEGMLMPTSRLTYLNPDKPYYLKDINDALTIAGRSFFLYTEESVYTFERAACLGFNLKLADQYGLGDFYGMVKDHTWTQDVMYSSAQQVSSDLDGNGVFDRNDLYGLTGISNYLFPSLYNLSGECTIAKDSDDIPYFNAISSQRFAASIERILSELDNGKYIYIDPNSTADLNPIHKLFESDQVLFLATVIGRLFAFREMESDFGVLPFPLYDEKQEVYYTRVVDAWLHVCPITNADPERTSVIMEALAAGSAKYVFPAYYDKAVTQKVLRDAESVEMIEIIRRTRIIDLGECPWFETVRWPLEREVLYSRKAELSSFLAGIENNVNAVIAKAVTAAEALEK